jgi:hypothetical protein
MATSGTVAFRPDVEEVISEAYERCGLDGQTRTGYHAVTARRSLNMLFSEFANRGINYWAVTQNSLSLVSGTTSYNLPAGTIDIIDAVIRDNSVDKQYTPVIYFWNVPDSSNYTLNYWAMNQLEDVTLSNQDTDIPYRWTDCICAGLASKLSLKYAPDKFQLLNEVYERSFNFAASSDNDGVSLRVQPTALNLA